MPWICMYLSSMDLLSPFLLFSSKEAHLEIVVSLTTSVSNVCLPYDTLGKEIE